MLGEDAKEVSRKSRIKRERFGLNKNDNDRAAAGPGVIPPPDPLNYRNPHVRSDTNNKKNAKG